MNRPPTPLEWTMPVNLASEPDFLLGQFDVRPSYCHVRWLGQSETVEPRVMQALVVLAQSKDRVVSRDELIGRCWGGRAISEDAIHRCIAKVRKLAELDANRSFTIETVPRVGYQMIRTGALGISADAFVPDPRPVTISEPLESIGDGRGYLWPLAGAGAGIAALLLAVVMVFGQRQAEKTNAVSTAHTDIAHAAIASGTAALPAGAIFKDCNDGCPEMVVVPSGYFGIGSARTEPDNSPDDTPGVFDNEGPQHEILIAHRFAVARYDVTRAEYARFAQATHRPDDPSCYTLLPTGLFIETIGANWRHPGFAQTSRDPVVCMNRDDANAYAAWLSRKTGKPYRLLSEAEWEYAARAGSNSARVGDGTASAPCRSFNGGDFDYHGRTSGDRFADLGCSDGFAATSPVGSFPPNAFGLFDMQGNVWQWTQDCYHQTYDGAPTDGSAWREANCAGGIVRGGSWTDDSRSIRFARRQTGAPDTRFSSNGFRIARSL